MGAGSVRLRLTSKEAPTATTAQQGVRPATTAVMIARDSAALTSFRGGSATGEIWKLLRQSRGRHGRLRIRTPAPTAGPSTFTASKKASRSSGTADRRTGAPLLHSIAASSAPRPAPVRGRLGSSDAETTRECHRGTERGGGEAKGAREETPPDAETGAPVIVADCRDSAVGEGAPLEHAGPPVRAAQGRPGSRCTRRQRRIRWWWWWWWWWWRRRRQQPDGGCR